MGLYIGVHSGINMPEDKVDGAWATYKASCENLDLQAHKLYYNVAEGKAYCITEASSKDEVVKAHEDIKTDKPAGDIQIMEVQTKE
ncbi:MAG: hypothetical protein Q8P20_08335 [bacterium]|nr:hypothetical protein [bacterium]